MFKEQLKAILGSAAAEAVSKDDIPLEELVKPSIFDNDASKRIKGMMVEVQEYIFEIEYTKANQSVIDKERNEAKQLQKEAQEANSVPEGFGKPQPNADQFKPVAFTVKPKNNNAVKRTFDEMQKG